MCCTEQMDEVVTERGGTGESDLSHREATLAAGETALVASEATLAARAEVLAGGVDALKQRESTLAAREAALALRMNAARAILLAADQRDAVSDARDVGGDTREQHLDRAHFLATGAASGESLPLRRGAALDREHAKGDRRASQHDRVALTEDPDDPQRT
jgi:hypothetical protein